MPVENRLGGTKQGRLADPHGLLGESLCATADSLLAAASCGNYDGQSER